MAGGGGGGGGVGGQAHMMLADLQVGSRTRNPIILFYYSRGNLIASSWTSLTTSCAETRGATSLWWPRQPAHSS